MFVKLAFLELRGFFGSIFRCYKICLCKRFDKYHVWSILRKYIKISHLVNLFALISTYSVKDSEDAWNWTFLRNCNPYFVNWPHSKMLLKLHFQGMWFSKTMFIFRDGCILVGHPSGDSYGQFYYYIMSSS